MPGHNSPTDDSHLRVCVWVCEGHPNSVSNTIRNDVKSQQKLLILTSLLLIHINYLIRVTNTLLLLDVLFLSISIVGGARRVLQLRLSISGN